MKKLRDPYIAIGLYILGLILMSALFYLKVTDKNLLNYFSFSGTYTSVFGIIIAYAQIISVRETAEKTEIEVRNSNKKIMNILQVSDLAKAIKLVQEIQNYLYSEKIEIAILRLKDLKSILILIKHNSELEKLSNKKAYRDSLNDVGINLNNLSQLHLGVKKGVSIDKIISDLEIIENLLGEFEGHLKFGNYD